MEEVADPTATAAATQEDEGAAADTSIAQRIKRSSRKSKPVSYAESDKDESDSDDESSSEAANLVVVIDGIPTIVSSEERNRRLHSVKLWIQHLERLRRQYKDFADALALCGDGSHSYVKSYHSRADRELGTMLPHLTTAVHALKQAKPAAQDQSLVEELVISTTSSTLPRPRKMLPRSSRSPHARPRTRRSSSTSVASRFSSRLTAFRKDVHDTLRRSSVCSRGRRT